MVGWETEELDEVDEDEDEDDDEDELYTEADRALLLSAGAGPLPLVAGEGASTASAASGSCVIPGAEGEGRAAAPADETMLVLAEPPSTAADGAASGAASSAATDAVSACLKLNRELQRMCREQLLRIDEALHCNAQARWAAEAGAADALGEELPVPAHAEADHRRGGESAFGYGDEAPMLSADAEAAMALREAVPHGDDMAARPRKWPLADRQRLRRAVVSTLITARHESLLRLQMDTSVPRAKRIEAERLMQQLPPNDVIDDRALVRLLDELLPATQKPTAAPFSAAPATAAPATAAPATAAPATAAPATAAAAPVSASALLLEDQGGAGPSGGAAPLVTLDSFSVPTHTGINWTELARTHLPRRSPAECESRWTQVDDPRIRSFPGKAAMREKVRRVNFTDEERIMLDRLAKLHHGREWDAVSKEMALAGFPNRQPMACFRYYKTVLLPKQQPRNKARWTAPEDAVLTRAVGECGVSNWARVSQLLHAAGCPRDANQCLQRWNFSVNPAIRRGEWEPSEDSQLRAAVQGLGPPEAGRGGTGGKGKGSYWAAVSRAVGGRTQAQCRERWCNVLDPSLERSPFSPEEDARLLAAVELYGERWSVVQRHAELLNRTDAMVAKRYHLLTRPPGVRGLAAGGPQAGGRKRSRSAAAPEPDTAEGPGPGAEAAGRGGESDGGAPLQLLAPPPLPAPASRARARAAGRATPAGGRARRAGGRGAGRRGGRAAAPILAQVAGEAPILAQVAGEAPILAQVAGEAPTLAQVAPPSADGATVAATAPTDAELRQVVTLMPRSARLRSRLAAGAPGTRMARAPAAACAVEEL